MFDPKSFPFCHRNWPSENVWHSRHSIHSWIIEHMSFIKENLFSIIFLPTIVEFFHRFIFQSRQMRFTSCESFVGKYGINCTQMNNFYFHSLIDMSFSSPSFHWKFRCFCFLTCFLLFIAGAPRSHSGAHEFNMSNSSERECDWREQNILTFSVEFN